MVSLQQWKEKLLDILDDTFYRKSEIDEKENVLNESIAEKADNNALDALSDQVDNIIAEGLDLTDYAKKDELTTENIIDDNDYYGIFPSTYASPNNPDKTQEEINIGIDSAITSLRQSVVLVNTLPTASQDTYGKIYLTPISVGIAKTEYKMHTTIRSGFSPNYEYKWADIPYLDDTYIKKVSNNSAFLKGDGSTEALNTTTIAITYEDETTETIDLVTR